MSNDALRILCAVDASREVRQHYILITIFEAGVRALAKAAHVVASDPTFEWLTIECPFDWQVFSAIGVEFDLAGIVDGATDSLGEFELDGSTHDITQHCDVVGIEVCTSSLKLKLYNESGHYDLATHSIAFGNVPGLAERIRQCQGQAFGRASFEHQPQLALLPLFGAQTV